MSKNVESEFNVSSNEDVADSSFITLHDNNIQESDNQDIVTNI